MKLFYNSNSIKYSKHNEIISDTKLYKNPLIKLFKLLFICLVASQIIFPQLSSDKIIVAPDSESLNKGLNKLVYGSMWRNIWNAPGSFYRAEFDYMACSFVLSDSLGSNLNYVEIKTEAGLKYRFTTLRKTGNESLPPEMRRTFFSKFANNQTYALFPYATVVSSNLLNMCNLPYEKVEPIFLEINNTPNNSDWNWRNSVGNLFRCFIPGDTLISKNAIIESVLFGTELFNFIENNNDYRVSQSDYLSLRLIQFLTGNTAEDINYWEWLVTYNGSSKIIYPVLLNFDRAFAKIEGFVPKVMEKIYPQLSDFDENLHSLNVLIKHDKLDKTILSEMSRKNWENTTRNLLGSLSENKILRALVEIPVELPTDDLNMLMRNIFFRKNQLASISEDFYKKTNTDSIYATDIKIIPLININDNKGITLGINPVITNYSSDVFPFLNSYSFQGAYLSKTKSFELGIKTVFNSIAENTSLTLDIFGSTFALLNYFGYGNETSFDYLLLKQEYYKLERSNFFVSPKISYNLSAVSQMNISLKYELSKTKVRNMPLLLKVEENNYGEGIFRLFSGKVEILSDSRDHIEIPYSGSFINLSAEYFPSMLDNEREFIKFAGKISYHCAALFSGQSTLSFHIGGEKIVGKYPYFQSVFLGGYSTLRGFYGERFSGDASLFSMIELRTKVTELNFLIRSDFGYLFSIDIGRVFIENDASSLYHSSGSFGLWSSYFERNFICTATISVSVEYITSYFSIYYKL